MTKISVVVNTWNEEKNIERCLRSLKDFANEIVVVDMESEDRTREIAKKYGARIFPHKPTLYVEPARNFAISKATGDWILVVDADEELSHGLAKELREIAKENRVDYVEIPRKNIIFGKWIRHSRWWPDYNVRFFKKGMVEWSDKIHLPPKTKGIRERLEAIEENALIHHNYQTIEQYIERLNRYSNIQAEELRKNGYKFNWKDIIIKPSEEFFSRFFAGEGWKDSLHGLALSLLQAFSELVVYLKVWEKEGFEKEKIDNFSYILEKIANDLFWWLGKTSSLGNKIRLKIKRKI